MVSLLSPACLAPLCLVMVVSLEPVVGRRLRRQPDSDQPPVPKPLLDQLEKDEDVANKAESSFFDTLEKVVEKKNIIVDGAKYFLDNLNEHDKEKILKADHKLFIDFINIVEKLHQIDIAEGLSPPDRR